MRFLEQCFLIFFQTSLTATIIMLIVFAVLKIFSNKINIKFKYILLNLILIRLIVPVIPETNINLNISELLSRFQEEKYEDVIGQNESGSDLKNNTKKMFNKEQNISDYDKADMMDEMNISNQNDELLNNTIDVASMLWCTGIVILIIILTASLFCFKRKFKNSERINDDNVTSILNKLKQDITLKKDIPVYICDERKSPCIFGIIRPKIYLPKYVLEFDEDMILHILLHELMHYKRKDLYLNILSWIILLLHWFNPLVWMLEKKVKIYREYLCDFCVLESLGEEKSIDYGMTIINLSKVFTNSKGFQFGLGFETNNIIKGRIEMIKCFKKGSYKISAKAALGCLVAAVVVCTNGITVNALDINNSLTEKNINQTSLQNKHEFLIDSKLKAYDDINKVREVAGFDFKLPDYNVLSINKPDLYHVIKVSDDSNAIEVYSIGEANAKHLSLRIFKDDPVKALSEIYNTHSNSSNPNYSIESSKEQVTIENIEGYIITLDITTPERVINGQTIPGESDEQQYFVWENEGVYYSLPYSSKYERDGESNSSDDSDDKFFSEVAGSLKNIDDIKNIELLPEEKQELSTETWIMSIYDKDDLQKVENVIGVNLKFPLVINNIPIQDSMFGITGDSDVENNNIYYELVNIYRNKGNFINFTQGKHDDFGMHSNAKNNGYVNLSDENRKEVDVEKVNIDDNEVYRCLVKYTDEMNNIESTSAYYFWDNDGIYYSVTMFNTDGYHDEIVKELINSKPIE